jgi:hypothetical protein
MDLQSKAEMWATVRAGKISSENPEAWDARKANGDGSTLPLAMQAINWGTPRVTTNGGCPTTKTGKGSRLEDQASLWQTVRANEGNAGDYQTNLSNPDKPFVTLNGQAKAWPTPEASLGDKLTGLENQNSLAKAVRFSHPVQVIGMDGKPPLMTDPSTISRLRLNPAFVCWLMGWPWWWTRAEPINCEQEETELFRSRLRSLLHTFFNESTPSLNQSTKNKNE